MHAPTFKREHSDFCIMSPSVSHRPQSYNNWHGRAPRWLYETADPRPRHSPEENGRAPEEAQPHRPHEVHTQDHQRFQIRAIPDCCRQRHNTECRGLRGELKNLLMSIVDLLCIVEYGG